jgi:hypothetical protein
MRQKLSKPSNNSNVSKANRQGNNNGKIFPVFYGSFKPQKEIDKEFTKDLDLLAKEKSNIENPTKSDNNEQISKDENQIGQ